MRKFIGNYILCVSVCCRCKAPLASPPFIVPLAQAATSDDDEKKKEKNAGESAPKPDVSCTSIVTKLPISRLRNKTKVDK